MNPVSRTLDYVGFVLLLGAAIALAGSLWFLDQLVVGVLLRSFFPCLAISVLAFLAARTVELAYFAASDPEREYRRADGTAARRSATVVAATWRRSATTEPKKGLPAALDDAA
jgi:hypothetical protein